MAFQGDEYALTGTAVNITTALGITDAPKRYVSQLLLRVPTAGADVFWGASNVTTTTHRAGTLRAADAYPTIIEGPLNLDEFYLVGTAGAGNSVFITLIR